MTLGGYYILRVVIIPSILTKFFPKLNKSLLQDSPYLTDLQNSVFGTYKMEALQCVLRGVLIKKKEASAKLQNLLSELQVLESSLKSNCSEAGLKELIHHEILRLMDQNHKHFQQMCCNPFHEWNSVGSWHERSETKDLPSIFFHQPSFGFGSAITSDILYCFHEYYSSLYNNIQETLLASLETFLSKTSLPKLSPTLLTSSEKWSSKEELEAATSSLPSGKSSGPDGFTAKF